MEIIQAQKQDVVIALGDFDGMHKGHQAVLDETLALAKEMNVKPCLFHLHKSLNDKLNGQFAPSLMMDDVLFYNLKQYGIEQIFSIAFDAISGFSPEKFIKTIIMDMFRAKGVVSGFNYHFGNKASGDIEMLTKMGQQYQFAVKIVPAVLYEEQPISSTKIRAAIEAGNVKTANDMLGHAFSYDFYVVSGDRLGRRLGMPTINQIFPKEFIMPKFGVYASKAYVDGKWMPAMTNIGHRPTVEHLSIRSETTILGYSGDLYGKRVEVALLDYLRDGEKYDTLDELVQQMKVDSEHATAVFKQQEES